MDGTTAFWLSLGLAVPIGLGVNLVTPLVARVVGRNSEYRRANRTRQKQIESRFVSWLVDNPQVATIHMVRQFGRFLSLVVVGFSAATVAAVYQVGGRYLPGFLFVAASYIALFVAIRVIRRVNRIYLAMLQQGDWIAWDLTRWSAELGGWQAIEPDETSSSFAQEQEGR